MAERLVPEHEPLNLERSRGRFFPGTFFSDPAWIFQAAALLFLTAFFYWPLTRFLFGSHPLDPGASFLELKILRHIFDHSPSVKNVTNHKTFSIENTKIV